MLLSRICLLCFFFFIIYYYFIDFRLFLRQCHGFHLSLLYLQKLECFVCVRVRVCACVSLFSSPACRVCSNILHTSLSPFLYIYLWLYISVYTHIYICTIYVSRVGMFLSFKFPVPLSRSNTSPARFTAPACVSSLTPGRLSCIAGAGVAHAGCDGAIGQRLRSSHMGQQAVARLFCGVLSLAVSGWCGARRHQVSRTHDALW